MASGLTGDFDVVAEFTLGAANRVLAAMHQGGRVPHSWSLLVDDYPLVHIPLGTEKLTGVRSVVNASGEPVLDPTAVGKISGGAASVSSAGPLNPNWDFPVNVANIPAAGQGPATSHPGPSVAGRRGVVGTLTPDALARATRLMGMAQMQLGAPTITLLDNSDTSVAVHTPVMARYTADSDTLQIPDFLHGEFQIFIEVAQSTSKPGAFINVNLAGKAGGASFIPKWVSPGWDSKGEQLAAINKALANSLQTSFQPSSTAIPSNILLMKLKTMRGGTQPAVAIMMDLQRGNAIADLRAAAESPDPATVANVFLAEGDDFAFAMRSEFAQNMFAQSMDDLRRWSFSFWYTLEIKIPNPVKKWLDIDVGPKDWTVQVVTITFRVSIDSATMELQDSSTDYPNGRILVTVQGSANTDAPGIPKFTFTGTQSLGLELVNSPAYGSTADLVALGDPDVQASAPGIPDWAINNYFTPAAKENFKRQVASFLKNINPRLQQRLSVKKNLGDFLRQMMNPVPKPGSQPVQEIDPLLWYTSFEIGSSGIVFHGTLQVPPWPKAHVEYGYRNVRSVVRPLPFLAGEYNGLRSWIPGGTITEHVWSQAGGPPLHDDHHTFLFQEKMGGPIAHLCLTIKGTRISAAGPASYEPVTATGSCAWHSPISVSPSIRMLAAHGPASWPKIALTLRASSGRMDVVGHMSPWATSGNTTNLLIHFPDRHGPVALEMLTQALLESGRADAATAIVAVLSPGQLAEAKTLDGVAFADDEKAWTDLLGPRHRPATFLISPTGDVAWRHEGPLASDVLQAGLKKHLVANGRFVLRPLTAQVRVGQPVPNFLFETAPGQELTLHKLADRFVALVFWISLSAASLETLRDLQKAFADSGIQGPVMLAINDGESPELAAKVARENGISAIIVPDPDRDIARAYGISVWPTSIFLDPAGLVIDVRYGRFTAELARHSPAGTPAVKV